MPASCVNVLLETADLEVKESQAVASGHASAVGQRLTSTLDYTMGQRESNDQRSVVMVDYVKPVPESDDQRSVTISDCEVDACLAHRQRSAEGLECGELMNADRELNNVEEDHAISDIPLMLDGRSVMHDHTQV